MEATLERGKHAIVFGERGVGKTSLVNVYSGLFPSTLSQIRLVREQVDPSDSFASLWRKVFRDIHLRAVRSGHEEFTPISEFYQRDISPDDVRRELQEAFGLNMIPIVVIDEFDKAVDASLITYTSNLIKYLSDYSVNVTIVLVGVADSVNDLIGEHESIMRCTEEIAMPRMSIPEMKEILDKRIPRLGMKLHDDAYWKVVYLSRGLPAYVHALGMYAAQAAIDRRGILIKEADVDRAINRVLERSQETVQEAYTRAAHTNRSDALYKEVLLACALSDSDERGHFTPVSVCRPLTSILKRKVEISTFQQHLEKFINEDRASILTRKGRQRAYKFRFTDPMMQPYVIMRGIKDGVVSPAALRVLSFPAQPELHIEDRQPF